jgi:hypothetical protein
MTRPRPMHALPLQPLGDGSDPEVALRDCADDHVHVRRVLCKLREPVLEKVGKDQTDRLRPAGRDCGGPGVPRPARRVPGVVASAPLAGRA